MGFLAGLKGAILAALFAGGVIVGAGGMWKWQEAKVAQLRNDLADAVRAAAGERAARIELTAQCAARDAAASDGEDRRAAVRRAVDQAIREADDAAASGDDGLGALLERLRGADGPARAAPGGAGGPP